MPKPGRYLDILVFVVGSASLGAEIAAARLLAPYFGASTIVWANTIAVVLVALSAGYFLGGRLSDRYPFLRGLCLLVGAAALLFAVVPFAAGPFLDLSVEALDSVSAGAFVGSLLAVLVLVAVPVTLLGAASPYALRLAIDDVEHSGAVAGRLYAISTAGSLAGTMLAALVLVPLIGTQRTFLAFSVALAIAAAAGLGWRYWALPVGLALMLAVPVAGAGGKEGERVLYEGDTPLQHVRVIEQRDGDRILQLNEGVATHSRYRPGQFLTGGYWDDPLVLPLVAGGRPPGRMAMLGNAGGTIPRAYARYWPRTAVDAVEIDGKLTELGRRYMGLHNPMMRVFTEDARPFLRRSPGGYDAIIVDAYRQPYIPFYLATREFFELAQARLAPGGAVIVNVGHPRGNNDLEQVLSRTMAAVFPSVLRDPVDSYNTWLVASEAPLSASALDSAPIPLELRPLATQVGRRIADPLPGGSVYTDDLAPVEWLIDRSILGAAAGE